MNRIRSIVIGSIAVFAASLLLAHTHPFGDAGLYAQQQSGPVMDHADVPPRIRQMLVTKCADCHSTLVRTPLYGHMAPFSWLMERDILVARKAMNLSQWNNYSDEERAAFKTKILLETKTHRMPLPQYRIIHWDARITGADIDSLNQWLHEPARTPVSQATSPSTEGDAARGKEIFERRCIGCHSLDQNREGPRLRGVFGRASGSVADFTYSSALKRAHLTWSEATLDRWLSDPNEFVPGNDMEFRVPRPQERNDLVRFLKESEVR